MSKPYKEFEPKWITEPAKPGTYRSIMKWGDPARWKAPKEGLYKLIKERFGLTDDDFKTMVDTGEDMVDLKVATALNDKQIAEISAIVGADNATIDDFKRIQVAYGKTMVDIIRLRKKIVENV
ncbi:MAG: FAD-binding oxidoreductase, partial [Clostridia bacterium]